jgi:undecaprenyl diphosphate synthase
MDGNGRWAKQRGWNRIRGHEAGVEAVRAAVRECSRLGAEQLTLYAFSTENWKRPQREIDQLMRLLKQFLIDERPEIMKNKVRLQTIGQTERLPEDVQQELQHSIDMSAANEGPVLCLALSYGGRQEIVDAARALAEDVAAGRLTAEGIDEQALARRLYTWPAPDPDLLIRTAGEMRLSNFLLWQVSYAELYVTEVLWPDFREEHLREAVEAYSKRERRFGRVVQ